jgi:hypothetical protein
MELNPGQIWLYAGGKYILILSTERIIDIKIANVFWFSDGKKSQQTELFIKQDCKLICD